MAKRKYKDVKFRQEALVLVQTLNEIVDEYIEQDLTLTLRQLYYQCVSRDIVPNTEASYKRVGSVVSDARLAGLLDWDAIEDRMRKPDVPPQWESISDLVEVAIEQFRLPRMEGQLRYTELWCEKDALAGVLAPLADDFHATLMVNRGYSSSSAMRETGTRILRACRKLKTVDVKILYLGDFDPSGEDMVRDVAERVQLFCTPPGFQPEQYTDVNSSTREAYGWPTIAVEKVALTWDQIQAFQPPPNPAKITDSRAKAYIEKHGASSWEVDALPPVELQRIVRNALEANILSRPMEKVIEEEERQKEHLRSALAQTEI